MKSVLVMLRAIVVLVSGRACFGMAKCRANAMSSAKSALVIPGSHRIHATLSDAPQLWQWESVFMHRAEQLEHCV